jgi:predicted O-linked N-acetylglucosamine transferase (SPINDLY family)
VPLALDPRTPAPADVTALRARFPEKVLLGTLAREEKISSAPFLEAVAEILKRNPQCGYIWTGKAQHPGIASFFQRHGLASRCHFVGWVDTPLYAAILDLFLETFPLGCGITGYQAMGARVPLVSFLDSNTVFGMQYWSGLMARAGTREQVTRAALDEYPVLCALDAKDYVELATRAINDGQFRESWREREARFYAEEIAGIARYSQRFFAAIDEVARRKAA